MTIDLTDEEKRIILDRREKNAELSRKRLLVEKSLRLSGEYIKWLHDEKRVTSFTTFVDEFGYQDSDASEMYKVILHAIDAVENLYGI